MRLAFKLSWAVATLLLVAVSPGVAHAATYTNLLTNGGFESGTGTGWGTLAPTGGGTVNVQVYKSDAGARDGKWFLEANTAPGGGSIYQDVPVSLPANASATFSIWVRAPAGSGADGRQVNLCLWALAGGNVSACQRKTLTTSWQQVQATNTMPAATATLRAQVYMPAGGNVDFDGGVLTDDLLANGGFENGFSGWSTLNPPGGGTVNVAAYRGAGAHDGTGFAESNTSAGSGSIFQDVPVSLPANASATFSIWVRAPAGSGAIGERVNVCLWALSGGNVAACQRKTLTTSWQQVQATNTMPAATATLRAQVYMPAGGNVDFDGGVLTHDLLSDGGFENGAATGWQTLAPTGGGTVNVQVYKSDTGAHDGEWFLESNTAAAGGSIYQDIPVSLPANASATFSIWVRAAAGSGAGGRQVNLCLWALVGTPTSACQRRTLTTNWQELQATGTMPAATTTLRAQIYMPAGGNIDFDGGDVGAPQTADAVYPPTVTAAPTASGEPVVGNSLSCTGAAFGNAPTSIAYAWWRDGGAISGATGQSYTAADADAGHKLSCQVTAANDAGSATATSPEVGPVTTPSTTVQTIAPPPAKHHGRRHVRVRLAIGWRWSYGSTRLRFLRVRGLPARGQVTIACQGSRCPSHRFRSAGRRLRAFLVRLAGTRYHAGDRLRITFSAPGLAPERVLVVIRYGRIPLARRL